MVTSLYHRMQADLDRDVAKLDRTAITPWLMSFASGKRLSLHHPTIGDINYEGIAFWGSPVHVFDSFVRLNIDDLIEAHLRAAEAALEGIPEEQFPQVVEECVGLLTAANSKLSARAAKIKGGLMYSAERGPSDAGKSRPCAIPAPQHSVESWRYRLNAKVEEVTLNRRRVSANAIYIGGDNLGRATRCRRFIAARRNSIKSCHAHRSGHADL